MGLSWASGFALLQRNSDKVKKGKHPMLFRFFSTIVWVAANIETQYILVLMKILSCSDRRCNPPVPPSVGSWLSERRLAAVAIRREAMGLTEAPRGGLRCFRQLQ